MKKKAGREKEDFNTSCEAASGKRTRKTTGSTAES